MEADNRWMSDPALKGIDKSKLTFLEKLFIQSQKVNLADKKEMMSFMLTLTKFSKENNISFEKNEVELIYSVIQKYADPEELPKMQQLSSYFRFL